MHAIHEYKIATGFLESNGASLPFALALAGYAPGVALWTPWLSCDHDGKHGVVAIVKIGITGHIQPHVGSFNLQGFGSGTDTVTDTFPKATITNPTFAAAGLGIEHSTLGLSAGSTWSPFNDDGVRLPEAGRNILDEDVIYCFAKGTAANNMPEALPPFIRFRLAGSETFTGSGGSVTSFNVDIVADRTK